MKKYITIFCICVMLLGCTSSVFAADGNVIYKDNAKEFIFALGSKHSATDLFANFKEVMPGDTITQSITVRNDASQNVKVNIYMRSLGAHEDSEWFLSKLRLRVEKSENNSMAYMFDASADKSAQLTDWVCLGTLYSGGEVDLNVILDVPVELDNRYQDQIGYLDWEFMVEEYNVEPTDPKPPKTGDDVNFWLWGGLLIVSSTVILIIRWKKKDKE